MDAFHCNDISGKATLSTVYSSIACCRTSALRLAVVRRIGTPLLRSGQDPTAMLWQSGALVVTGGPQEEKRSAKKVKKGARPLLSCLLAPVPVWVPGDLRRMRRCFLLAMCRFHRVVDSNAMEIAGNNRVPYRARAGDWRSGGKSPSLPACACLCLHYRSVASSLSCTGGRKEKNIDSILAFLSCLN